MPSKGSSKSSSGVNTKVKTLLKREVRRVLNPGPEALYDLDLCVLTRASSRMDYIGIHQLLRADTSDSELDRLEYAWNWQYDTLSLVSRWNLLSLTLSMRDTFAADRWFWILLDSDLLGQMHGKYVSSEDTLVGRFDPTELYPHLGSRVFKYHFVPTSAMRKCWAVQTYSGTYSGAPDPTTVQQHWYPFAAVVSEPVLLHVPPHFVICDTGAKLDRLLGGKCDRASYARLLRELPQLGDADVALGCLIRMHEIYRAWMSVTVPDSWKGEPPAERRSRFCETDAEESERASLASFPSPGLSRASSKTGPPSGSSRGSAVRPYTAEEDKRFFDGLKKWARAVAREGIPPDDAGPLTPDDGTTGIIDDVGRSWVGWALPDDMKKKRKREP